jgi:hypothetical protein
MSPRPLFPTRGQVRGRMLNRLLGVAALALVMAAWVYAPPLDEDEIAAEQHAQLQSFEAEREHLVQQIARAYGQGRADAEADLQQTLGETCAAWWFGSDATAPAQLRRRVCGRAGK